MAALPTRLSVTSDGLTLATTAYVTGDVLDNEFAFASAAQTSGGTGTIYAATLVDKNDIIGACQLYLFESQVTGTDNAAFAPSDANTLLIQGILNFPPPDDVGGARIAHVQCQIPYKCAATTLYSQLVTRTGHTFFTANTDLQVQLFVVED
jgi:hypothetical protein